MCHCRSCGFLDFSPTIRILHDGIAEVINYCRDGENTAQPLIQGFFGLGLLRLRVRIASSRQSRRGCGRASPAIMVRLVMEVERDRAIGYLLNDGSKGVPFRQASVALMSSATTGGVRRLCATSPTCLFDALLPSHWMGLKEKVPGKNRRWVHCPSEGAISASWERDECPSAG